MSSHKLRESAKQIEEAFTEYDRDRDDMLNETELETMIRNTRPTLAHDAAAELVEQIWKEYSQTLLVPNSAILHVAGHEAPVKIGHLH